MKLGMAFGYWRPGPRTDFVELARTAERLGYDSLWVSETWGNDAFTYAAYIAAGTSAIKIGTSIVQMAARTPTATAMAAATLDYLSGGRVILGLGVSGPQVVEGWYGQPSTNPVARTREYVEIIRRVLRRDRPLVNDGVFYPVPYRGAGGQGLGKPLKIMSHPLRTDLPIFLGAEGPKNVAQTAEIADGWLPLYYSPFRQDVYSEQLKSAKPGFQVNASVNVTITNDVAAGLMPVKSRLAFYVGGMGTKGQNFHANLMHRMGFQEEALRIQDLFLAGRRDEAVAAVPDDFADELSLVGPPLRIRQRMDLWRQSPVTTLIVSARAEDELKMIHELVIG